MGGWAPAEVVPCSGEARRKRGKGEGEGEACVVRQAMI